MKRRRRIGAVGLGRDTEGLPKCSLPRTIIPGRDSATAGLTLSSRTSRAEHARERTESTRGKTPASRRSTAPTRPESKRFWSAPATARAVADVRGRLDYSTAVKLREHPFGSQDRTRGKEARDRIRSKSASGASRSAAAAPASFPLTVAYTCCDAACPGALLTSRDSVVVAALRRIKGYPLTDIRPPHRRN